MDTLQNPRPSPIAGQWYPGEAHALIRAVDSCLQAAAPVGIAGDIVGVVAPHAGYRYSGPVAGYAFAPLKGLHPGLVVLVAPMHQPSSFPLLTSGHDAYRTPLGYLPIDLQTLRDLNEGLQERLGFGLQPILHDGEHAVEIELPFLQRALGGDFYLAPIMLRDQSPKTVHALGEAIAEVLGGREPILIASTDLSHFYPQAEARRYDLEILRRIEAFDPLAVLTAPEEGAGFACGCGAVASVLWAARILGADQAKILRYATSGDVTGDYSSVVGYGAAVIFRSSSQD